MPYLTGFADEASPGMEGQIRATRELGWNCIEARGVEGKNIHDISDEAFDRVCGLLAGSGVKINCFGSAIANWSKSILDPFDITLREISRAIPRMRRLDTRLIRVMSYAVLKDRGPEDQEEKERFRRLREMQKRFADAGIQPVHENCMNYGGMGWTYSLRLLENVPGMKLVFDTGNPPGSIDYTRPEPRPMQSSWEFYSHVREHVAYVHIKDAVMLDPEPGTRDARARYTFPGEGAGDVRRIFKDLIARGYDGGISIEPHMAVVHHEGSGKSSDEIRFATYVEYGRRTEKMIRDIAAELKPK
jgi:sugar phosphate isomerase/epimerase